MRQAFRSATHLPNAGANSVNGVTVSNVYMAAAALCRQASLWASWDMVSRLFDGLVNSVNFASDEDSYPRAIAAL